MSNLLLSLKELGEFTTTQRDYTLKAPAAVFDKTNLIVAFAVYTNWAALVGALVGGPEYAVIASSKWSGVVSQDYDIGTVLGSGLGLVGPSAVGASVADNPAAAALAGVAAAGYGWTQTFGDNVVALSVKTAVVAGAPMIGSSTDGFWDDIAGTVLTSASDTAYNMGYSGVGGYYYVAATSSLVAIAVGAAHIRTLHAAGLGL